MLLSPLLTVSGSSWSWASYKCGELNLGFLTRPPVLFPQPMRCTPGLPVGKVCPLELLGKVRILCNLMGQNFMPSTALSFLKLSAFQHLWHLGSVYHFSAIFAGSFPQSHSWLSAQNFLLEVETWRVTSLGPCATGGIIRSIFGSQH